MRLDWMPLTRRGVLRGAAALGVAAAVKPRVAWSAEGNVLRFRRTTDLQTLDPGVAWSDDAETSLSLFPGLIRFKPTYEPGQKWEWELDAATSIEQVDPTHIKFALRPGIAWTNGFGEMTAEDVKYSYERIANPENEMPYQTDWEALDRVDVIDDHTGVIVLKEPFVALWTMTLPFGRASIICKVATEAAGGGFTIEPPATAGPYQIKEWVPKQRLVLARNPLWNGPRPDFDEVRQIPIDDDKIAELAFEAGDLDFVRKIALSSLPKYKESPPADAILDVRPLVGWEWVGMNVDHPPFDDVRVRRAVQLAVDVDAVLEAVYLGLAERATGLVAPGLVGYRGYNRYANRDVEEAKRLLANAGFPNGFKTTLSVLNDTDKVTMAQVIQANLGEAGIEVEIIPYESGMFWTLGMESEGEMWKDLAIVLNAWGFAAPDAIEATRWFTREQVGVWDWERWHNDEYDELYQQAIGEFDDEKRHKSFVRMQDLMEESGAYLSLSNGIWANLYRDTIRPATSADGRKYLLHHFKRA